MLTITCLDDIAALRESTEIECKLAQGRDGKGALPKDIWETYSSFANTQGGDIFLGLKELENNGFELAGIENTGKVLDELWTNLNNKQKVSSLPEKGLGVSAGGLGVRSGGSDTLKAIAAPVAEKKRAPKKLVETTILELCQEQMLTLDEIVHLLKRSVDVARKDYLQPMIKNKRLTYRYPTNPNHPDQAYLTNQAEDNK